MCVCVCVIEGGANSLLNRVTPNSQHHCAGVYVVHDVGWFFFIHSEKKKSAQAQVRGANSAINYCPMIEKFARPRNPHGALVSQKYECWKTGSTTCTSVGSK